MTSKRKKEHSSNKNVLKNRKILVIPIISVSLIVFVSVVSFTFLQPQNKFSLKAAIIDQLEEHFQNVTFKETAIGILTDAGFTTTYYESKAVNVTFYQELAKQDYGIIILRAHSALRYDNSTVDLFTSERFNNQSYPQMWANGYLAEGKYLFEQDSNNTYFAITSKFIENLDGHFPRSIVVAMGCWSLKFGADQMAQAFIDKGAEAYIGWSNIVLPKDTDQETIALLEMLVHQDVPLATALSQTKTYTYLAEHNTTAQTRMNFHPYRNANLTLSQLIASIGNSGNTVFLASYQNITSLVTKPNIKHRNTFSETTR